MDELNVNTPEGLRKFLLAEAELDTNLYSEDILKGYLQENRLAITETNKMTNYLLTGEA